VKDQNHEGGGREIALKGTEYRFPRGTGWEGESKKGKSLELLSEREEWGWGGGNMKKKNKREGVPRKEQKGSAERGKSITGGGGA